MFLIQWATRRTQHHYGKSDSNRMCRNMHSMQSRPESEIYFEGMFSPLLSFSLLFLVPFSLPSHLTFPYPLTFPPIHSKAVPLNPFSDLGVRGGDPVRKCIFVYLGPGEASGGCKFCSVCVARNPKTEANVYVFIDSAWCVLTFKTSPLVTALHASKCLYFTVQFFTQVSAYEISIF